MDITYSYTRPRGCFGRQPLFCEQGPELCDSIAVDAAEHRHYVLRNPVHQPTQHTPLFSEHHVNTVRADYVSSGANHAEGGWPRDVNVADPDATQRYRRKVEKDDGYIRCVTACAPPMDHCVLQNNAVDMYRAYYVEMPPQPPLEHPACRTVNVYRDGGGSSPRRPIASLCWQPDGSPRFAVAHLLVDFDLRPRASLQSYVWNLENANAPEVTIEPPCPLLDVQFNARDPAILAGGLMNGQVGVWDVRAGGGPQLLCALHVAHREYARSVRFINAKSGREFFSGGPDGVVKWWDLRDLSEPTDQMIMDVVKSASEVQSQAAASGVSILEFEPTIPTRFMVGTEEGCVIAGNRKGKTPLEKLPAKFQAHLGPVWSLERNPGFLKNFLTVGDWTARVWSEDCRESAVVWSPPHRHKVTAGAWSPTRLSLMLLTRGDGVLALWDLLRRQHEPVLTVQVCEEPLLCVRAHDGGKLVACGSQKGDVFMLEVSAELACAGKNDKALLTAVFEREAKRERILEARTREIRLKQRQAEDGSPRASATDLDPALGDRDLADAAAEYLLQLKKELAAT